ncbi:glutathione S-transferase C-terminal domain-containing protein [Thalassomonas viridans]|uniref:Glutathione S-transferase C-terminal domain-containing protein n=1 Tax=Thalassomonas viridans TaxID=137584 RepID=A0AAE9Z3Q7_9GAMM|nr:glutathione S-transferase C-terminal domain-containing protein [Thalassomonas viridans]WDE06070.1 glutathione S-transferase C-terminal domain-containing protein [Thalassomonas viridans]
MSTILVKGVLKQASAKDKGALIRSESEFRHWITKDGGGRFSADPDRYHLFISPACPWSHRVMLMRKLKGLCDVISVTLLDAIKGDNGWKFEHHSLPEWLEVSQEHFLYEVYLKADPEYTGKVSVPVLWDRKLDTIVSNDSGDIMRMFNTVFADYGQVDYDYCPPSRLPEIERINSYIHENITHNIYQAGFSSVQADYDDAVNKIFRAFDELDRRLSLQRYLAGNTLTEADLNFFTTLVRFDVVYYVHFKVCLHRVSDYEHLREYLRDLYQIPAIAETVDMEHIKRHYYRSHYELNPNGIIPAGPAVDFTSPHLRDYMGTNDVDTLAVEC